jgi:hypothetical protein
VPVLLPGGAFHNQAHLTQVISNWNLDLCLPERDELRSDLTDEHACADIRELGYISQDFAPPVPQRRELRFNY